MGALGIGGSYQEPPLDWPVRPTEMLPCPTSGLVELMVRTASRQED